MHLVKNEQFDLVNRSEQTPNQLSCAKTRKVRDCGKINSNLDVNTLKGAFLPRNFLEQILRGEEWPLLTGRRNQGATQSGPGEVQASRHCRQAFVGKSVVQDPARVLEFPNMVRSSKGSVMTRMLLCYDPSNIREVSTGISAQHPWQAK